MGAKLAKAMPVLLGTGLAVELFESGRRGQWWVIVSVSLMLAGSCLVHWLGGRAVRRSVRAAAWCIDTWMLGLVILDAAAVLLVNFLSVWIANLIQGGSTTTDEMLKTSSVSIGVALVAAAQVVFTKDFANSTGSFWPSSLFQKAVQAQFKGHFEAMSPGYQAVYEDRVRAAGVDVTGWGFRARHKRAKMIDA